MDTLRAKVNSYVKSQLNEYKPLNIKSPKVIHDSILGTNPFFQHEIMVIDSPLIQRLRRISQVDVVPLVFPSGNHNRFEHSLGVTVIADKLVRALHNKKVLPESTDFNELLHHVRMAGILHDCGHCAFSHMSEDIYGEFQDFKLELDENRDLYGSSKPHEILSYLIVTSDAFKNYYVEHIESVTGISFDFDLIGQMIIGHISMDDKAFWVEIINGAFDADKLDYIQRDSHFTGIQMILDLDRLFHCLDLIEIEGKKRLTIDFSGVSTLEQIVFDKMMLISTVYNHHKVRAAECVFRSIFDDIIDNGIEINDLKFTSAADFLYLTDDDIYYFAKNNIGRPSKLARYLLNRTLPKRSLIISGRTIYENNKNLQKIMSLDRDDRKHLAALIAEEANKVGKTDQITAEDIWLDLPRIPSFKEGSQWPIKSLTEEKGYITLRKVFPVDDWSKAFSENKWKGHIFTWPQFSDEVNQAAKSIMEEAFDISLNDSSRSGCKID